jgi:hypothetical protein
MRQIKPEKPLQNKLRQPPPCFGSGRRQIEGAYNED